MKNFNLKYLLITLITLIPALILDFTSSSIIGVIAEIIVLTIPIIAFGQKKVFAFSFKSFFETFVVGGALTIATAYYLITKLFKGILEAGTSTIDRNLMIGFLISIFIGAGIREELLTRGFLCTFLRKTFGNTKASYIAAITISSVLFGLIHLTNLRNTNDPEAIYSQIIYAIGFGFFLGALYIRTGNLWANMILHYLFDISLMFGPFVIEQSTQLGDAIKSWLGEGILIKSIIFTVACFALELFLLRDSKLNPILEAAEREEMAA